MTTATSRFLFLLLLTLVTVVQTACQGSPVTENQSSTLDRVLTSGILRAGYVPYPPSLIVDPNSKTFSGISHDVLSKVAENLDVELEYTEEVGWGSMIEAIESDRIDVIATAIWPTAARAKRADFTLPFFYSTVRSYVRIDDRRFDGDLRSADGPETRIAVIDGEMAAIISAADFPQARRIELTQLSDVSQLLLEVGTGKADLTFVEPAVANQFISKNPGLIRPTLQTPPVRVFPNVFLIKKGQLSFKNTLDVALGELLNSAYVDRVLDEYETAPGEYARVAQPFSERQ